MKNKLAYMVLLIGLLAANANAQGTGPAATVTSFYRYDWSHSQIFNRRNLDARKRWLSPALYKLFRDELTKEQKHLAQNPTDKPYFGDGFPFFPLREGCTVNGKTYGYLYNVSSATKGPRPQVKVRFFYPKQCEPHSITYTVELIKSRSAWLIDDLIYESGDRLSENMKNHRY